MGKTIRFVGVVAVCMAVLAAPDRAEAETFSLAVNYGGDITLACVSFDLGAPPGFTLSDKFIDGIPEIPAGAQVTDITVRIHGYRGGTGVEVAVIVAGEMVATAVDPLPDGPICNCEEDPPCQGTDFVSGTYLNGWPGWNYAEPNSNRLEIDVTAADGDGIAVDMVTVFVTYQFATPIPSTGWGALLTLGAVLVTIGTTESARRSAKGEERAQRLRAS